MREGGSWGCDKWVKSAPGKIVQKKTPDENGNDGMLEKN